jgi:hypothetical protein
MLASGRRKRSKGRSEEKEEKEENGQQQEEEEIAPIRKKTKTSGTLKDKILAIVHDADTLISLQKIKKELISEYHLTENKSFNTNVNKALKALVDANGDNFGKIGGSYHGGVTSRAYLDYSESQKEKLIMKNHQDEGEILCPYCNTWCSCDSWIREDSVARGGLHQCEHCPKQFWSWISDSYLYGHKKEYRYGDGREDYKEIN